MEDFLYDKNNNGIRSRRKPGIGYAKTFGNLRLELPVEKTGKMVLRSTGSEAGGVFRSRMMYCYPFAYETSILDDSTL